MALVLLLAQLLLPVAHAQSVEESPARSIDGSIDARELELSLDVSNGIGTGLVIGGAVLVSGGAVSLLFGALSGVCITGPPCGGSETNLAFVGLGIGGGVAGLALLATGIALKVDAGSRLRALRRGPAIEAWAIEPQAGGATLGVRVAF